MNTRAMSRPGKTGILLAQWAANRYSTAIGSTYTDAEFVRFLGGDTGQATATFNPEIFFERVFATVDAALPRHDSLVGGNSIFLVGDPPN